MSRDPIDEKGALLFSDDPFGVAESSRLSAEMDVEVRRLESLRDSLYGSFVFDDTAVRPEKYAAASAALVTYRELTSVVKNRIVFDPRWIGSVGPPHNFNKNDANNRHDYLGLLSTVECWHQNCMKLPTTDKRCECHCIYASDENGCRKICESCWLGKGKSTAFDLCKCTCEASGADGKLCDQICKKMKKVEPF